MSAKAKSQPTLSAELFLKLLTDDFDPEVCFQIFPERKDCKRKPRHLHGRISRMNSWLAQANNDGCGVFVVINQTDGKGRRASNIVLARAVFADFDGNELPGVWPLQPHIIVESSPGKFQVYWLLNQVTDLDEWSSCQARVAALYSSDPKVHDPSRVMRLPGFFHQKGKPFCVRIVKHVQSDEVPANGFSRYDLSDIIEAHPCEFTAPSSRSNASRPNEPEAGWDDEGDIVRAIHLLKSAAPAIEGDHGDDRTYEVACQLHDLGISPDKSLELMLEHINPRCSPEWTEDELKAKIRNAHEYAQNSPGVASIAADFQDEDSEGEADDEPSEGDYDLNAVNPRRINWQFAVVNINGKVRVMHWGKSPIHANVKVPEFMTQEDFRLALKNKRVRVEDKSIPLADYWLNSSKRKTYDGFTLDPTTRDNFVGGKVNLWRGFSVHPAPGDWSLMQKHIMEVMASGDSGHADYITKWVAWAFQNPEKQAEVALVFLGGKGTGKGFFARAVCETFGVHGIHLSDRKHVTGHFNSHYMQCALLYSDEAIWPGHKEDDAAIKRMLTEPTLTIEPKGVNAFALANHLKTIMTGNEPWLVSASADERRYAVFQVSDKHQQDGKYFAALKKEIDDGGNAAMLHDLLQLDLNGWHPRDGIPQTEALSDQKRLSAPPEVQWLGGLLEDGILPGAHGKRHNCSRASELYQHARQSLPALKHWSDVRLSDFLSKQGYRKQASNGIWWEFPPLPEARAALIEKHKWGPESGPEEWTLESLGFDD